MSDSMWKKEISFKRKPKAEADAAAAEAAPQAAAPKQSVLKKEISFSRKPKQPKEPKAASESLLKKEISFSRKPKTPKAQKDATPRDELTPTAGAPTAPKQSFLKKEISLSRKKRDREIERLVHEAEQTVSPAFAPGAAATAETLPTALAEAAVAAMVEAAQPAPVVEPSFVEHAPIEEAPVEEAPVEEAPVEEAPVEHVHQPVALAAVPDPAPVELHAVETQPVTAIPTDPEPVASVDDTHAVPVLPVDAGPELPISTVSPAILDGSMEESPIDAGEPSAPEPAALEPAAFEPAAFEPAALEPVAPAAETWAEPTAAAEHVEPWLAEPELPPAPEAAPATLVHPPVPASELPPLPEDGAEKPFWKKELSFSRTSKGPKAAKAPKPSKAARAATPKPASGPFWKKELSLGRKPRATQAAPAADAPTEALPKPMPAKPFWKKQVSFSKPSLSLPTRSGRKKNGHAVKKLVGLKIGASQLAAARVSNNGVAELQQVARDALASGIVVGGELRDPEALGEALKVFFAKHKLPRKGVRLGIASNRIGVRIFDIVGVDQEKQLANAVHFRAQEALPIPLDEALLDYHVVGESVDEEGQTVKRVLLVVAYRELIERYVSACRIAGITLAGIDLEAFALLRALAAPVDRGAAALVAVAIGHDRSTFAVSDGRVCEFTRVLEWGGWSLNVALARVFDSTPSEVEAIKRSLSLDGTATPAGLTAEQAAQALDAVRRQVQSFARELVSSLQFYQNQPGSLGIGEIVLTGGTTGLAGLAEELERLIGVHVRVGDPLTRVKVAKHGADTDQIGSLAVAIGLGIED